MDYSDDSSLSSAIATFGTRTTPSFVTKKRQTSKSKKSKSIKRKKEKFSEESDEYDTSSEEEDASKHRIRTKKPLKLLERRSSTLRYGLPNYPQAKTDLKVDPDDEDTWTATSSACDRNKENSWCHRIPDISRGDRSMHWTRR